MAGKRRGGNLHAPPKANRQHPLLADIQVLAGRVREVCVLLAQHADVPHLHLAVCARGGHEPSRGVHCAQAPAVSAPSGNMREQRRSTRAPSGASGGGEIGVGGTRRKGAKPYTAVRWPGLCWTRYILAGSKQAPSTLRGADGYKEPATGTHQSASGSPRLNVPTAFVNDPQFMGLL